MIAAIKMARSAQVRGQHGDVRSTKDPGDAPVWYLAVVPEYVIIEGVHAHLPAGWYDITGDLPAGSPLTLARNDGRGALQFSIAAYAGGVRPHVTPQDLMALLLDFGRREELGAARETRSGQGSTCFAYGDFSTESEVTWVWYVSDGDSVAFVTYVATVPERVDAGWHSELREAAAIARSVRFDEPDVVTEN